MKPLTIEELKALEVGDWIYVSKPLDGYCKIVWISGDEIYLHLFDREDKGIRHFSSYGKKWLAYKNREQAEAKGEIVELPCKRGDVVYYVEYFCNYKGCSSDEQQYCCGCKEMIERERNKEKYVIAKKKFVLTDLPLIGKKYFTDKSEAEARLKELKGE